LLRGEILFDRGNSMSMRFPGSAAPRHFGFVFRIVSIIGAVALLAGAGEAVSAAPLQSGLQVPRFVSLKAGRVNVRVGPGEDYKIAWVFTRTGLPIEVIQEYDTWRRIRDSDGAVGWVFNSLLSGKRTAVVAPWASGDPLPLRSDATADAAVVACLEPGVQAGIERCRQGWCRVDGKGFDGWIRQDQLWGVYPNEEID
jgi:SH3-like domain-containing protein